MHGGIPSGSSRSARRLSINTRRSPSPEGPTFLATVVTKTPTKKASRGGPQIRVPRPVRATSREEQFAKLILHEHPQYQEPITLDVLPEEIGELPDSEQLVSIEVIQPWECKGQRALLSVDRFNQLAADGDMHAILMNTVAAQQPQPQGPPQPVGVAARPTMAKPEVGARSSGDCHIVGASRSRKPPTCESTLTRSNSCGQHAAYLARPGRP
jgi:hypothetical protein